MLLLIDNYDSFSYNLVQAIASQNVDVKVFRNDEITVDEVRDLDPQAIVISPGPCTPQEAGISVAMIQAFTGKTPLFGVCLGHQCIAAAFGATVSNAARIMHGKVSQVEHDGAALFTGVRNPFVAGRYHSLSVIQGTLPDELCVTATSEDGEIMGMRHTSHETYGVQFHPESVLTPMGKRIIRNFLRLAQLLPPRA